MEALPKSRLLRFVEQARHLARRTVARYSSKFSKRRYTLHQHIVLLCLKVRKNTTYRKLLDELIEMPRIRSALDLEEIPSPSTLCKAFNRLDMAVWRALLNLSVTLLPTNGVVGIDASGFDRNHASMDKPQSDMPTERALSELEDEEGYLRLWLDGIQFTFQNWDDYDGVPQLPYYTFKILKRELKVPDQSENETWKVNTVLDLVANFADKTEVFYGFGDLPAGERASDRQDVDALRWGALEHIFWFNYFSEPIVSEIGREQLLDAPGERVEERPSGAVLFVPYLNLADRSGPHPREVEKYLEICPP